MRPGSRQSLCVGAGVVAVAASLIAATATGHPKGLEHPRALVGLVEGGDGVQRATARRIGAVRSAGWNGGPTVASTGETVNVYVSDRYPPEQHSPQAWADFVAALPHGSELAAVTVHIAPLDEVQAVCGSRSLGCYGGGQLYASGDTHGWVTPQEIVRHEYGHHIAANRLNPPWRAVDWGPKAWGTDQEICTKVAGGTAYPGDESDHYELNPGEAWAESYRVFAEQRAGAPPTPWEVVDPSFQPDADALAAVEKDVLQPWAASTTAVYKKRFTATTPKSWSIPISTQLDGDLAISVSLPKGGYHTVVLLGPDGKTVVSRALWSGTTSQRLTTTVCGQRSLTLRVTRRGSLGRVAVVVTQP